MRDDLCAGSGFPGNERFEGWASTADVLQLHMYTHPAKRIFAVRTWWPPHLSRHLLDAPLSIHAEALLEARLRSMNFVQFQSSPYLAAIKYGVVG